MERIHDVAQRIKTLEVKGARRVAIAALEALQVLAEETKAKSSQEFMQDLLEAKAILFASRPTEPLMRNAITFVIDRIPSTKNKKVNKLSKIVLSSSQEFLSNLEASREKIAEVGAKRILNDMTVFTHCHSSTVTNILRKAKKEGKNFEVICTETRPVFQGRITAQELLNLEIKTTIIVDSAARSFIKQANIVLVGADALTSEGGIVNKIGTSTIALLAQEARVPFYVASELLKFDAATLCGEYEAIEERSRNEVWKEAPQGLIVKNPAFEATRAEFIHGLICEEGIIPSQAINDVVQKRYPWIYHQKSAK